MTLCTFGGRFVKTPKLGQPVERLQLGDWKKVFETKHAFDAHAWPYVRYLGVDLAPAVRASARNNEPQTEGTFLCNLIFLDYDDSTDHHAILGKIAEIPEDHYLNRWAVIYPTKGGMRLVYRLSEPVLPAEYVQIARGVSLDLYRLTTLKVDPTTDQWHRCFRLPSVTRNDEKASGPTWETSYFFDTLITDEVVDPDELPHQEQPVPWKQGSAAPAAPEEMPDVDQQVPPSRMRAYRKALRNSRYKEYVFDHMDVLQGRRDQTLMGMAGEVVAKCFYKVPECSAEEVFALLCPVALGFVEDGVEAWTDKLWRMVQHSWNAEVKKEKDRTEKDAVDRTAREQVIEAMLSHMPKGIVPNDPYEREQFARRHFCLQTAAGVFAVTESGEYTTQMLKTAQVPAHFNCGLSFLDSEHFTTPNGKKLNGGEILNSWSTVVDHAKFVPSVHAYSRLKMEGDKKVVEVSPFSLRSDLVEMAELDHEVGEWLDAFADAEKLKLWLASALAIHRGPIAALFLKGPARAGKSMIAMGLAECFGRRPVSAMQAFSDFNGGLTESPVILVDEGLPNRRGGMDTADLFRSLITGSGVSTQKKFMDQLESVIPYRMVMAANSYDMVTDLIGKRSLGTEDMEAFRERILVIEPGRGPSDYLDRQGNMAFTADDPKGSWIGGRCRLARHIIRLYQMHFEESEFVRDGRRMLVEGHQHPAFTLAFDLSGQGREVVQAIASGIESFANKRGVPGLMKSLEVVDGNAWIRKWPFATANGDNATAFAKALDRFCTSETRRSPIDMSTSFKVNLTKVLVCSEALGLSTKAMRELEEAAKGIA